MKALVFGRTGQIATELQRLAPVTALGREAVDLRDPGACAAAIHAHRPEAVINAAAYTAVDRAETEEELSLEELAAGYMRNVVEVTRIRAA